MQQIRLTASQIKELATTVGFEVKDVAVDDWLPEDTQVTVTQFDEPTEVRDEDGAVAGYWKTVATFEDAPENGAWPIGESTPPEEQSLVTGAWVQETGSPDPEWQEYHWTAEDESYQLRVYTGHYGHYMLVQIDKDGTRHLFGQSQSTNIEEAKAELLAIKKAQDFPCSGLAN